MADSSLPVAPKEDPRLPANAIAEMIVRLRDENKSMWFQINRFKDLISKNETNMADLEVYAEWIDPNES